jgi:hypothetical protein
MRSVRLLILVALAPGCSTGASDVDMGATPDLAAPLDLAREDLTQPPDLTTPPDHALVPGDLAGNDLLPAPADLASADLTQNPALGTPTNVAAGDGTSTARVTVTWTGVTGATSYRVYRDTLFAGEAPRPTRTSGSSRLASAGTRSGGSRSPPSRA